MKDTKKYLRLVQDVLWFGTIGVLWILLRYLLKIPQPLRSILPGEEHFYAWTRDGMQHKIYYNVSGAEDAPPLVLFHAPELGASAYEFRAVMADLAQKYRVYAPDLLGFGLSDHPAVEYSPALYIALFTAFLEQVVGHPAVIVASGLSCNYSVIVAQRLPTLCERLVLLSPPALFKEPHQAAWFAPLLRVPGLALLVYATLTLPALLRLVIAQEHGLHYRQVSSDELDYALASALQIGSQHAALAYLSGALNINALTQFELLSVPVLLIHGTTVQPLALPASMERQLLKPAGQPEQINILALPDAGLRVHEERPAEIISILLRDQDESEAVTAAVSHAAASAYEHANAVEEKFRADANNKSPANLVDKVLESAGEISSIQETGISNSGAEAVDEAQQDLDARESEQLQEFEALIEKTEAYCVKCREKREMQNARRIVTKNGRNAMEGTCPVCSTRLFRFISG